MFRLFDHFALAVACSNAIVIWRFNQQHLNNRCVELRIFAFLNFLISAWVQPPPVSFPNSGIQLVIRNDFATNFVTRMEKQDISYVS